MAKESGGGQDQRKFARYRADEPAELVVEGRSVSCRILDISAGGAGLFITHLYTELPTSGLLVSKRFGSFHFKMIYRGLNRSGVVFEMSDVQRLELASRLSEIMPN